MDLGNGEVVVVDVETSGTNPFSNEVLSIALVPLNSTVAPCVVHVKADEIVWNEYARKNFQGFESAWNASAVSPLDACNSIEQYLKRVYATKAAIPAGHNVGFDAAFLRRLAFRAGKAEISGLSHRTLDTHTMLYLLHLKKIVPASALSSDGAFRHFGIVVSEQMRHTALGDALATRELLLRILDLFSSMRLEGSQITEYQMSKKRVFVERGPEGDFAVRKPNSQRDSDIRPSQVDVIERPNKVHPRRKPLVKGARHTAGETPEKWRRS